MMLEFFSKTTAPTPVSPHSSMHWPTRYAPSELSYMLEERLQICHTPIQLEHAGSDPNLLYWKRLRG